MEPHQYLRTWRPKRRAERLQLPPHLHRAAQYRKAPTPATTIAALVDRLIDENGYRAAWSVTVLVALPCDGPTIPVELRVDHHPPFADVETAETTIVARRVSIAHCESAIERAGKNAKCRRFPVASTGAKS